jgi:hypothetical protein
MTFSGVNTAANGYVPPEIITVTDNTLGVVTLTEVTG